MKYYEESIEEISKIVSEAWKKVDSGFYPEIDQEIKLLNIQKMINDGKLEEGFWNLVGFLIRDFLAMSKEDLVEEKEGLVKVLKELNNPTAVQKWLEKIKDESQNEDKTIRVVESLQQII